MNIYGTNGEPLMFKREEGAPKGFVLMTGERPDNFHVCKDNGDGSGTWEYSKPLEDKLKAAWKAE